MDFEIDLEQKEIEDRVTQKVLHCVKHHIPFYFISGAGSGKTHSLIEGIKEYIKTYYHKLKNDSQKILCISFTNNSVNDIVNRVGDEEYINASTIHAFLWDTISHHQNELIEEHAIYLDEKIKEIKEHLFLSDSTEKAILNFRKLNPEQLLLISSEALINSTNFYKALDSSASEFWFYISTNFGEEIHEILKSNYKTIGRSISQLVKISKLENCLVNIYANEEKKPSIKYYGEKNIEILHKNVIGHETLLIYSARLIKKYSALSSYITDLYPLILVDEFQDTDSNILESFKLLYSQAKKKNKKFCIGFFGDPVQAIYNNQEHSIDNSFELIIKNINRRSHQDIVNLINNIRGYHQAVIQSPIKQHKNKSDLSYSIKDMSLYNHNEISGYINYYIKKWKISNTNKLTCLVLKNKMLSELCNFSSLYELTEQFYTLEYTKGYELISSEFLFKELSNAGKLPSLVYSLSIRLYNLKFNRNSSMLDFYNNEYISKFSLKNLIIVLKIINNINFSSLWDFYEKLFIEMSKVQDLDVKCIIQSLIPTEIENLEQLMLHTLSECNVKNIDDAEKILRDIFCLPIDQLFHWIDYLTSSGYDKDVNFLTCHASKGLEFENVLVFLDDSFHRNKNYVSNLLNSDLNLSHDEQIESARRLFYVSCSRAIKNLNVYIFTKTKIADDKLTYLFNT